MCVEDEEAAVQPESHPVSREVLRRDRHRRRERILPGVVRHPIHRFDDFSVPDCEDGLSVPEEGLRPFDSRGQEASGLVRLDEIQRETLCVRPARILETHDTPVRGIRRRSVRDAPRAATERRAETVPRGRKHGRLGRRQHRLSLHERVKRLERKPVAEGARRRPGREVEPDEENGREPRPDALHLGRRVRERGRGNVGTRLCELAEIRGRLGIGWEAGPVECAPQRVAFEDDEDAPVRRAQHLDPPDHDVVPFGAAHVELVGETAHPVLLEGNRRALNRHVDVGLQPHREFRRCGAREKCSHYGQNDARDANDEGHRSSCWSTRARQR